VAKAEPEPAPMAEEKAPPASVESCDDIIARLTARERRPLDISGKLYLAPLTTVGNLPFRRICTDYGADITIGEMAMAKNVLAGQASEWALFRKHPSEARPGHLFGVQVCGAHIDMMARVAQSIEDTVDVDFVDVNMGCPIDLVCKKGGGCEMLERPARLREIVTGMSQVLSCPLTVKMRMGKSLHNLSVKKYLPKLRDWGAAACTLHGRTKEQRYTRSADWAYIEECSHLASVPFVGNGDIYSYEDAIKYLDHDKLSTVMIARGALVKPWLFTEIKEKRHWDISSSERFDMMKQFCDFGLEHWGSDNQGVATTRRFFLEWHSFMHRYVPVGLLERPDVCTRLNLRPPRFYGRDELEELMASPKQTDWLTLIDRLLPVRLGTEAEKLQHFEPAHNSYAYNKNDDVVRG